MIILLVLFAIVCLWGVRRCSIFRSDYMSRNQTDAIKGVFILFVFFSHINTGLVDAGFKSVMWGDSLYLAIPGWVGQLMVVMFLFYSGYGVMESIKTKGAAYMSTYPRHRLLTTLLNFDVAVLLFALCCPLTGKDLSVANVFLSLLAWDTVGNSNWYIFTILICYLLTWLSALLAGRVSSEMRYYKLVVLLVLFGVVLSFVVLSVVKDPWWYDTIFSYWAGMLLSLYKEKADKLMKKFYYLLLPVFTLLFFILYFGTWAHGIRYNVMSVFFAILVVLLTMRWYVGNKALEWLGTHLFPIYIYMRLPALILLNASPTLRNLSLTFPWAYVSLTLFITLLLAKFYPKWQIKL